MSGRVRSELLLELDRQLEDPTEKKGLDLKEVTLVDLDVVRFLGLCVRRGIELHNCALYIQEWITREQPDSDGSPPGSANYRKNGSPHEHPFRGFESDRRAAALQIHDNKGVVIAVARQLVHFLNQNTRQHNSTPSHFEDALRTIIMAHKAALPDVEFFPVFGGGKHASGWSDACLLPFIFALD